MKAIPKGKEITGAITKHMDRRFLSSLDLIGMGVVELTVDRVEKVDKLEYLNGNSNDNVILLYFVETDKPLALCATNVKAIIRVMQTSKASDWKGKKIKLQAEKVKAFGKTVDAVRVVVPGGADNINKKLRG